MELHIPGYQIVRPLAQGGMACVYLAIQESLQRQVALKLLRNIDNPVQAERFANEGRIIASLNHRNIITIHDIGLVGERPYISMEYLEEGDLERRIHAGMSAAAALELVEILGECLEFLHRRGIIHRDIKPANILFRRDGTPVLTDFGIAKRLDQDRRLTLDSTALGSPYYLSPEQAECKPVDGRSDIYGLGIILYEMLTGRKPFEGDSPIEIILAHLTAPRPALPETCSGYQDLIDRMIAKSPEKRFGSATEMLTTIRECREHGGQGMPAARLSIALHRLRETGIAARFRDITGGTRRLLDAGLKHTRARRARAAVRIVRRRLGKILPAGTRLPRVAALVAVVLLVFLAAGSLLIRPTVKPAKVEAMQAPAVEPPTHPVVLRFKDELALQRENDLTLARRALDEFRLTTPPENNAWYYYRRVLEGDPNNAEALTGVGRIAEAYADLAERELDAFHYRRANVYIERGLAVDPGNERLVKLREERPFPSASRRALERVKSLFR